jgi:hypothetical protein
VPHLLLHGNLDFCVASPEGTLFLRQTLGTEDLF